MATQTSRITNTGTYLVNGMFDEFTGAPVVDTSLQLWLDAGQTSSYSGTGNTWTDLSVSGNSLTLTNGPTFASTSGGGAIVFDGVDDYASGSVSPVFTGNAPHSIDAWFYLTSYGGGRSWILVLGQYNSGAEHWILSSATGTQWGVWGAAQLSPNIPLNTWINVITTFDGTTYTCYKNGVSIGSTAATFNFTSNVLYLGLKLGGEVNMTGSIASCKLYNRALSANEVVQNYNALSGRFGLSPITTTQMPVVKRETSNAVILTNGSFDEFTGAPVVDTNLMVWLDAGQLSSYTGTGASWVDLSGNAKNYTLNNSPTFNTTFGGGVLTFTGASGHYANAATTLFNSTTTNTYSVNLWVYPTGAGQMVSVNGQSTPNTSYHYSAIEITAAGLIYFGQWAPGMTTVATSSQSLNTWYNLVLTYNGTTATAYVNGVSAGSNTIGWSAPGASTFFTLMSQDSTNMTSSTAFASGSIGAFSVYNRALTAAEVVQNYNALSGRYNKSAITSTQMPVVKRETNTGTIFVNGGFDEFTGVTLVDTSLVYWVDAAQSASYSGSGNSWINLANVSGYTGTRTFSAGNTAIFTDAEGGYFDYSSANVQATVGSLNTFGFSLPSNPIPTTGSFTISALIQRRSATTPLGDRESIFSNAGSGDGYRFGFDQSGYPYYLIGGVSAVGYQEGTLGTTVLTDGRWRLLTIVYDRAAQLGSYTIYGYVDNILSGSAAITAGAGGNVAFTNSTTTIGNGGCCRAFGGKISTVFAYGRALSADEVSQNFNALRRRYGI